MFLKTVQSFTLNEKYYSIYAKDEWTVTYEVGKWAYPSVPGTRLWVYELPDDYPLDYKSLRTIAPDILTPDILLYKCEVTDPMLPRVIKAPLFDAFWREFWLDPGLHTSWISNVLIHDYTRWVTSVRLLEQIRLEIPCA